MEEPQAKRVRLDIADIQRPAVPGPELLEDMTLSAAKTVVHHLESLQEAYMAELKNLLQQLQSYREAQTADEQANAVHQGAAAAPPRPEAVASATQSVEAPATAGAAPRPLAAPAASATASATASVAEAGAAATSTAAAAKDPPAAGTSAPPPAAAAGHATDETSSSPTEPASAVVAAAKQMQQQMQLSQQQLSNLTQAEALASALAAEDLDDADALACLCSAKVRYLVKRYAVTIGRDSQSKGSVDVDLSHEGDAGQVSRQQAQLAMSESGCWRLRVVGRQGMCVDGRVLQQGEAAEVQHLSLIEVGRLQLLLLLNPVAARRMAERAAQVVL